MYKYMYRELVEWQWQEKNEYSKKTCSSTTVMHHKTHVVCPGIKHWLQCQKANNQPPEL